MAAAAKATTATLARPPASALRMETIDDVLRVADVLYRGGLTPPGVNNPTDAAALVLCGMEVGLAPTQAMGSIMKQNGRLTIYGDGAIALVRASGLLESIEEWVDGDGPARTGHCKAKRKGEPEKHYTFSMAEAEKAKLFERARGKDGKGWGPWLAYPDRMLKMRARGFLFRDVFPDVLRGLILAEEAGDIVETEVKVTGYTTNPAASQPAAPAPQPAPAPAAPPAQLVAPAPAQPAQAVAPQPAPQPDPVTPALAVPAGPVTDAQKERFLKVRQLVCTSARATTADEQRAAWASALAPFGVQSVGQLDAQTAEPVLASLEHLHDPFGGAPKRPPAF